MRCCAFLLLLLLTGCASPPASVKRVQQPTTVKQDTKNGAMTEDDLLFYLFRKEYNDWKGVPYLLGGNSKKGVDCSAFVKNIYQDSLNIKLPRTTKNQVESGSFVYQNQLQVGDLIFFKTGWRTRHVGIYIGKNQFIHASTSKGVMTSSLKNSYWKDNYWQSRRIID